MAPASASACAPLVCAAARYKKPSTPAQKPANNLGSHEPLSSFGEGFSFCFPLRFAKQASNVRSFRNLQDLQVRLLCGSIQESPHGRPILRHPQERDRLSGPARGTGARLFRRGGRSEKTGLLPSSSNKNRLLPQQPPFKE